VKSQLESTGDPGDKPDRAGDATKLRDQLRCLVEFLNKDMERFFSVQRQIDDGSLRDMPSSTCGSFSSPVILSFRAQQRSEHTEFFMSLVGVQYLTLIMNRQLLLVRLRSHCEAGNSTKIKPSHSRIQEHTFLY